MITNIIIVLVERHESVIISPFPDSRAQIKSNVLIFPRFIFFSPSLRSYYPFVLFAAAAAAAAATFLRRRGGEKAFRKIFIIIVKHPLRVFNVLRCVCLHVRNNISVMTINVRRNNRWATTFKCDISTSSRARARTAIQRSSRIVATAHVNLG